jgi:methionyl-tRNA synthetase
MDSCWTKNDWKPNVYGQVKSWIDGGLEPRAVTRDLDWELMFPLKVLKEKLYVWFDADWLYFSTKEWALRRKRLGTILERSETKLVHFIGKDKCFHCVIFPAMLKAEGSYMPDNVPANEFLNLEGNKFYV